MQRTKTFLGLDDSLVWKVITYENIIKKRANLWIQKTCASCSKPQLRVSKRLNNVDMVGYSRTNRFWAVENKWKAYLVMYCQQLDKLKTAPQEKRLIFSRKDILHHDMARLHTDLGTHQKLTKLGWEIVLHPPYSLNLALFIITCFWPYKFFLQAKKFKNKENIR